MHEQLQLETHGLPRVRRRVAGTISVDVSAERRRLQELYGWLSNVRFRRGTVALYHEGIGRPEHRAETLSSPELSASAVYVFTVGQIYEMKGQGQCTVT